MSDLKDWLMSGQPAVIDGLALRPQPHSPGSHIVLEIVKGQAAVYYLRDNGQGEWMLKKFRPGRAPDAANVVAVQSLVPQETGFEAAFLRRCLRGSMVSRSGFAPPEFIDWIDGTLLMPRIIAADWSEVVGNVRDGQADLSPGDRVTLAENLCAKVEVLERARLAHRDLSATNVMADPSHGIHLIDWDSLYAPSLRMPANTTAGTDGYTAPFVRDGNDDPAATWTVGGDRFALAVLILEAFAAAPGCPMTGDGSGLIEQSELNARGGPGIRDALDTAARCTSVIEPLFMRALQAHAALECPSPREWQQSLRQIVATRRRAANQPAGHFIPLDMSVFVQLDHSQFTRLY
jgi:hypothetical protein